MAKLAGTTMPREDDLLLRKANKKIADLKEDICRLSDDLKNKEMSNHYGLPLSLQPSRTQLHGTPPPVHGLPPARHLTVSRPGLRWWSGVARKMWKGLLHLHA